MSSRRPRLSKSSRWDNEGSSRDNARTADERLPSRRGPAGLIFMCNSRTKTDCFHYKVLGLPHAKKDLVEQITPGVVLFLYDIDMRELHGIFEASSHGGLNLEPKAFQGLGSYPAQVRFTVYRECLPLPADVFKGAIQDNFFARNKFNLELTSEQVSRLVQLFSPIEAPRKRLHGSSMSGLAQEVDRHRLGLPERTIAVSGGIDLANRIPQYRLPAPGIRVEERLPRHDAVLRLEPRPLPMDVVERAHLPQMRVLDGRSDRKDLLSQGRLEEVDQLALKYLEKGNPPVSRALDHLHRNPGLVNAARTIPGVQEEAVLRARALETERLRRAVAEQAILREQASSRPMASFAGPRAQPVAASGPLLRPSADMRRRR